MMHAERHSHLFRFLYASRFEHLKTCGHVGLPGPCFKTGEIALSNATSLIFDQNFNIANFKTAIGFQLTIHQLTDAKISAKRL